MIGRFVTSKAGHDKTQLYIVVRADGDFVYLCDGRLKPFERPKKKRKMHVQVINRYVENELLQKLTEGAAVRDEELKYAIKQYKKHLEE